MTKISSTAVRKPASHIPIETCTRLLTTSPEMSNKSRKLFMQARGNKIDVERQEPKTVQEKYCAKLRTLSLRALGRQLAQAARQIKIASGRLSRADPDGKEFTQLKQVYTLQLYRHGWIEQEYQRRTAPKPVPPAPRPLCDFSEAEIEAMKSAAAQIQTARVEVIEI